LLPTRSVQNAPPNGGKKDERGCEEKDLRSNEAKSCRKEGGQSFQEKVI